MVFLSSIDQVFENYKNLPIFFEPLDGNNGDTLIEKGTLSYLQSIDINRVRNPDHSKAIIINGGGAMNDFWKSGLRTVEKYSLQYPHIPLIVLPSSFAFQETDFPSFFKSHKAPVFLFAREQYSLDILKQLKFPPCVSLGIDHDMAFCLNNTNFIHKLKSRSKKQHILIVERNDIESATSVTTALKSHEKDNVKSIAKKSNLPDFRKLVGYYIKNPLRHHLLAGRDKLGIHTEFSQKARRKVLSDYPEFQNIPVYAADISSNYYFSFGQFSQLVAEAAIVVTTRLHVAILAAMLDKPTYVKTGSYHKIRGVFEFSLQGKNGFYMIDKI